MTDPFAEQRLEMVRLITAHAWMVSAQTGRPQLSSRVLEAMAAVPRHEFVPAEIRDYAYADTPLPIGFGKTISQPFIVALMTDLLDVVDDETVLEIGTGFGYQAAILAELGARVFSVEIIEEFGLAAEKRLARLGHSDVRIRVGDGGRGWPEFAPFEKIIVTAAPETVPRTLLEQLDHAGRMVIPAGTEDAQQLYVIDKDADGRLESREILPVRFSRLETAH